jgi:hypothetical protein
VLGAVAGVAATRAGDGDGDAASAASVSADGKGVVALKSLRILLGVMFR